MIKTENSVNELKNCQPQQESEHLHAEVQDTIPCLGEDVKDFVEVKFNKEVKRLSLDEAAILAQKGMKFDMLSNELEMLKNLSQEAGLSVTNYLYSLKNRAFEDKVAELTERCGGDRTIAEKLALSPNFCAVKPINELNAEFPELGENDIPEEVKTAAELKGTGLLFEYLLYEHRKRRAAAEEIKRHKVASEASLGSLKFGSYRAGPDAEFIKGIWGK